MNKMKDIFRKREQKNYHAGHAHLHEQNGSKGGYQCPMRCEGDKIYDAPGRCPVCNMVLVPVEDVDHKMPGKDRHLHQTN